VTIVTSQGYRVETLIHNGRQTPFQHKDYYVLRVAVNRRPYPAWQIPAFVWQQEVATLDEREFWQNVADAALSMGDVEAQLRI